MHEYLPYIAAVGITVPIAIHLKFGNIATGFLSLGLSALFLYFGK